MQWCLINKHVMSGLLAYPLCCWLGHQWFCRLVARQILGAGSDGAIDGAIATLMEELD